MAILIRTSDIPAAQRHDAWRNVVCDTLGPLDFRSDPGTPLRGEIAAGQLGPVNVGRVKTSTPHSVYRTAGLIRRDSPELYRVALTMSGRAGLLQDGRTAQLRPGEFTLYDFTRPYELAYDSGVQLAVFSFPREMLALPADLVAKLTAVPVRTDAGTGALAAPLLRLVTTAVAEHAGQAGSLSADSREQTLLLRIHAFIEEHLGDAGLVPAAVAAAHYISVRYLYRLFEAQGTTVAAWIRHRRLERCRADLADPAFGSAPVSAVAGRWGLPDSAHFNRLFKRTYGLPPAEYRRACLAPVTRHPQGHLSGCAGNVNRLAAGGNAAAVVLTSLSKHFFRKPGSWIARALRRPAQAVPVTSTGVKCIGRSHA